MTLTSRSSTHCLPASTRAAKTVNFTRLRMPVRFSSNPSKSRPANACTATVSGSANWEKEPLRNRFSPDGLSVELSSELEGKQAYEVLEFQPLRCELGKSPQRCSPVAAYLSPVRRRREEHSRCRSRT